MIILRIPEKEKCAFGKAVTHFCTVGSYETWYYILHYTIIYSKGHFFEDVLITDATSTLIKSDWGKWRYGFPTLHWYCFHTFNNKYSKSKVFIRGLPSGKNFAWNPFPKRIISRLFTAWESIVKDCKLRIMVTFEIQRYIITQTSSTKITYNTIAQWTESGIIFPKPMRLVGNYYIILYIWNVPTQVQCFFLWKKYCYIQEGTVKPDVY